MRRLLTTIAALALLATARGVAAAADAAPAGGKFMLDEYNVDAMGGPDNSRIALGLSFGSGYANGWWWTGGPRVSWIRWDVDIPKQTGFGLGGTIGGGYRPDRKVSPYGGLSLEYAFSMSSYLDWLATVSAGARVRIVPGKPEHFAMTFSVYRAQAFGGNGPSGGDFGVAVLYSAAIQAPR